MHLSLVLVDFDLSIDTCHHEYHIDYLFHVLLREIIHLILDDFFRRECGSCHLLILAKGSEVFT